MNWRLFEADLMHPTVPLPAKHWGCGGMIHRGCSQRVGPANPRAAAALLCLFCTEMSLPESYCLRWLRPLKPNTHSRASLCCREAATKKERDSTGEGAGVSVYCMSAYSLSICGWKRDLSSALLAFRVGVSRPFSMVNCSGWRWRSFTCIREDMCENRFQD